MKTFIPALLVASAPLASAIALPLRTTGDRRSLSTSTGLPVAPFSIPIANRVARSSAKQNALRQYRSKHSAKSTTNTSSEDVLSGPYGGEEYAVNITIGGQVFSVILDTGSSDLWVPGYNFSCISLEGDAETPSECNFGPGVYNSNSSATYEAFGSDGNFNITYGDGEFLTGVPAYDTVTVGNLTVPHQLFSIVDVAAWNGDNVTAGLLGLASPYLTSVFNGSDPTQDDFTVNEFVYNPFFYSAVADNLTAPYFSIALNRPTFAQEVEAADLDPFGYIAFGGIPAEVNVTDKSVTVQDLSFKVDIDGVNSTEPLYYTIAVDKWTFDGSDEIEGGTSDNTTILDSGTTLLYLRSDISAAINAAFDPPAIYNPETEAYDVDCDAQVPKVAVTIGGTEFDFESADLIYFNEKVDNVTYCISSVLDGGDEGSIFILGDRFLVNVVATFDIETKNITLTERLY